jgi:hypothetical protein
MLGNLEGAQCGESCSIDRYIDKAESAEIPSLAGKTE